MRPGMSVSRVAQSEGVNAHQVFDWRRLYRAGRLIESGAGGLVPVVIGEDVSSVVAESIPAPSGGSIHIEFPGRALVTIEPGVDALLAGVVIERLAR